MNKFIILFLIVMIGVAYSAKFPSTCDICKGVVEKVDDVLKQGGDIKKAVHTFCKDDLPSFLVDVCEKMIAQNLDFIIDKLKDHEPAEKICADIHFC